MHRVFTHLRMPTGPSIHCVFLENPDCPTLVEMSNQRNALSHVLMEFAYDCFNANPHIDSRAKIANAACAAIGAGAWMEVLPVEPELTMSDDFFGKHNFRLRTPLTADDPD